jgi:hypothetical protein
LAADAVPKRVATRAHDDAVFVHLTRSIGAEKGAGCFDFVRAVVVTTCRRHRQQDQRGAATAFEQTQEVNNHATRMNDTILASNARAAHFSALKARVCAVHVVFVQQGRIAASFIAGGAPWQLEQRLS